MSRIIRGNVYLNKLYLKELPDLSEVELRAGVNEDTNEDGAGGYTCSGNNLKSLKGAPHRVNGGFHCGENRLASLAGAPTIIQGNLDCAKNPIETLDGWPTRVDGNVYAQDCGLKESAIRKVCKVTGDIYV